MSNFRRVDSLSEGLVQELCELFQREWWTRGRTLDSVREAVSSSSLVMALLTQDGHLAAFARVLTDGVFKALIFDVIVKEDFRRLGLGKTLVDAVLRHPSVARVKNFELYCRPELASFYARFGFSLDVGGIQLMRYSPLDTVAVTPSNR